MKSGRVNRGWLGVHMEEVSPERVKQLSLPDPTGALVPAVVPGGPTERACLRAGDVVRMINGKQIANSGILSQEITALVPGQTAELTAWRHGKEQQVKLEVGQRPPIARCPIAKSVCCNSRSGADSWQRVVRAA